jgi:RimJ/RimL family protein N-acetyltransferase
MPGSDAPTPVTVPEAITLRGRHVQLEPLALEHVAALVQAASEDRSTYGYTHVPDGEDEMVAMIDAARREQAAGWVVPFATRDLSTNRIVGSTRFLDLDYWRWPPPSPVGTKGAPGPRPSVAEIGTTWLAASAQRTPVNTEAKWLMLNHAFEEWKVLRVTLKTDARNARSRRAIERIGAQFEGIRRAHAPAVDGGVRDSAYFSVLAHEWPEVSERLVALVLGLGPGQRQRLD